ncbi:MAG: hypothetical protein P1U77_10395 [Rubripirellula sp.]|nr:hypothetical protein [Rubripirellula sp.]
MSIDHPQTAAEGDAESTGTDLISGFIEGDQLKKRITKSSREKSPTSVFGKSANRGKLYHWGVSTSIGGHIDPYWEKLASLACDGLPKKIETKAFDWGSLSDGILNQLASNSPTSALVATESVVWAAALPALVHFMPQNSWWRLLSGLQQANEAALQRNHAYASGHLILGGELGLTLACCLSKLPHCKQLQQPSIKAVRQWCENDVESVADSIQPIRDSRMVLASLIRNKGWIASLEPKKAQKKLNATGQWLATWVAATARPDGTTAFSTAPRKAIKSDLGPHGLLEQAKQFDCDTLAPAIDAALGKKPTGGRLAWEVSLPAAVHHEADNKLIAMQCEWDVSHGKVVLDYSGEDIVLEVSAGKKLVLAGQWQTQIEIDEEEQLPAGSWTEVCEFTDDDVHYLEIEQPWSDGVTLQRQILQFREDRALLLADAVLMPKDRQEPPVRIQYSSRLPMTRHFSAVEEPETREMHLADKRSRVLALPLAANEWKIGPSDATLRCSDDHHLVSSCTGVERLYCPLWLDFTPRRFRRKRTWRSLTVADQLRIVPTNEAVAYRIQQGSEQWVVYRSLDGAACRTFLGKHILADFFCSRFHPGEGDQEELITVDDHPESYE